MFEITTQFWQKGRLSIHRLRPLYETWEQAKTALDGMKRNRNLIYHIRETDNNGN